MGPKTGHFRMSLHAARSFRPFTGQIGTYSTVPEAVGLSSVDYPTRDIESLGGRARIGCLLISHMVGDLCQAPVFRSQFGHRFDELTLTSWEFVLYSLYVRFSFCRSLFLSFDCILWR